MTGRYSTFVEDDDGDVNAIMPSKIGKIIGPTFSAMGRFSAICEYTTSPNPGTDMKNRSFAIVSLFRITLFTATMTFRHPVVMLRNGIILLSIPTAANLSFTSERRKILVLVLVLRRQI